MKDSLNKSFVRLLHIKNAISEIEKFVAKKERIEFLSNDILSSAILFQFSVIGEAIIHVEGYNEDIKCYHQTKHFDSTLFFSPAINSCRG